MKYIILLLIVAILVILFVFHMTGKMFLRNLKRKNPGEEFSANIDVSFYEHSPVRAMAQKGKEYMETLPCEDIYIKSRDGLKLHGMLFMQNPNSHRFLLGIHGFQSHAYDEFAPHFKYFEEKGFNMLLVDDRAHGYSEGDYITMGVKDRFDCVDWAKYIVERFGNEAQILLHGVSMGGASVLSASGEDDLPKQVIGTISDCGFSSVSEALYFEMKAFFHVTSKTLVRVCAWYAKHKAHFLFDDGEPIKQVQHAKVPILFVQGDIDHIVPAWMATKLYEACSSKKKLVMVANASHAESIAIDTKAYHDGIEEMFGI